MMKTKSESNLAQRFDFVAVDIPLDGEPEQEKDKENETQTTEDKKDEPIKQDEAPPHSGQRGRRPSVFEEGLKEIFMIQPRLERRLKLRNQRLQRSLWRILMLFQDRQQSKYKLTF